MKTLQISDDLYSQLSEQAEAQGVASVEQWLQLVVIGPSIERRSLEEPKNSGTIGHDLDEFFGDWSAAESAEFNEAVEVFNHVDESFWE